MELQEKNILSRVNKIIECRLPTGKIGFIPVIDNKILSVLPTPKLVNTEKDKFIPANKAIELGISTNLSFKIVNTPDTWKKIAVLRRKPASNILKFKIETDFKLPLGEIKKPVKLAEKIWLMPGTAWDSSLKIDPELDARLREQLNYRNIKMSIIKEGNAYYLVKEFDKEWLNKAKYPIYTDATITYGDEYVFNSASTYSFSVASLDTTHFVVAYKDGGNSSYGTAVIGTVSGTTISYGAKYVFNSGKTDYISVDSLDSTHFVVAYQDYANSKYGTAIIGTVSNTTISYGSEYVFNSGSTEEISVASLDSTHFVVVYQDVSNSYYGTAIIGTVSDTTISYGSEYVFNTAETWYNAVASLDSTHFVVAYQDVGNSDYGTAIIGVVSGTTISYGAEYVFYSDSTSDISVSSLDSTHFVVTYSDDSSYGTAIIGTVSDTTISYGSEYVFNSATTFFTSVASLDSTHFVVAYMDMDNSFYGTAIIGTVSGTTISYGDEYVFNASGTEVISVAALNSTYFVIAYKDGGNSNYGTAIIGQTDTGGTNVTTTPSTQSLTVSQPAIIVNTVKNITQTPAAQVLTVLQASITIDTGWYNNNWQYRKKITVDASKVSASLSNFQVYLDLSQLGSDFFSNVKSDGGDIRITTSDGETEVAREIQTIDTANEKGIVWFKAPSLSGSTDTDFYIYYGNASVSDYADSDIYGANNVWNSDYKLVAHLEESGNGTSGEYKDKTSNANHGTGDAAPTRSSTTKLGGYTQSFNDSNTAIDFPDSLANGWTEFTFSCWFKCPSGSADNNTFFCRYISGSPRNWVRALVRTDGTIQFQPAKNDTYYNTITSNTYDDNNWHYVTFVFDGNSSTTKIYVDGSQQASGTGFSSLASGTPTNHFSVGTNATGTWWYNGLLDEVRVAEAVLSADWIATEYNNQNSPSTFYTIGTQETSGGGTNVTVTPDTISLSISQQTITVTAKQNITVSTNTQTLTISQPAVTVAAVKNTTQNLTTQSLTISQLDANINSGVTIDSLLQGLTVVMPAISVVTVKNATQTLQEQVLTISIPALTIIATEPSVSFYNIFRKNVMAGEIDFENDTIKAMLVSSSYTFDADNHQYKSDITAEITGTGYTAGGKELAGKTVTQDNANDLSKFDADDLTWNSATFTCRGLILYKDTGTGSTSPLIFYVDFGEDKSPNNENFTVSWSSNGVFTLSNL